MADEKVYLGKDQLALVWQLIKNAFVAKVEGKGLSTNDFTNDLLTKLTGIQTGATAVANSAKNGVITINGKDETVYALPAATASLLGGVIIGAGLSIDDTGKLINAITKLSQLENDAGFITASEVPETYTLPDATATVKGGVKIGNNVKVVGATISVDDASASTKGVVQLAIAATDDDTKAATAGALYDVNTDLSAKIAAKQSPATSLAGYGITDAYTKTEINSMVSSVLHYKGTKTSYSDLPTTGNVIGDVWNIETANALHNVRAGDNVAWNGTTWDVLAGTIDLSAYVRTDDLREMTETEIKDICV